MSGEPAQGYQRLLYPRTAIELRRGLERASSRRIELILTDNRRSVLRTIPRPCGRITVRLHHMFLYGGDDIVEQLARYIANPIDRAASRSLDDFIACEADRARGRSRRAKLRSLGRIFDLDDRLTRLNDAHFEGGVEARITWSRGKRSGGRERSIVFGTYTPRAANGIGLIRIHPALDQSWVPVEFLDFVIFHEMLHALIPVVTRNGRRVIHPPEFRARERDFPHYAFATRWERTNLHRFLDRSTS